LGRRSGLDKLNLPENVRKALRTFLIEVKEELGEVEVYLFGSYARGDWLLDSDLDLIVISPKFKNLEPGKRYLLVRGLLPSEISVELLLYTPEEFEERKRRSTLLREVTEYWVKLL